MKLKIKSNANKSSGARRGGKSGAYLISYHNSCHSAKSFPGVWGTSRQLLRGVPVPRFSSTGFWYI